MKKKEIKVTKKLLDREKARMSKKEKKALAALDRKDGTGMRPAVFADRRFEKTRPNVEYMYRSGKFD